MKSKELHEGGKIKKISELIIDQLSGFACAIDTMVERDGYVQLRPFNFGDNGRLKLDTLYQIPLDQVDTELYTIKKGDILFNNTNSLELVGKSVLVDKEYPFAFSNHINRIRVDANLVLPAYFQYQLRHMWIKGHFAINCKKWIGQAGYTVNKLAEQTIFLPSFENQQKIIQKLDNQLAQIEMMKKEAEKQRDVLEVVFESKINEEMQALQSNLLDKYNLVKLEDVCDLRTGGTPSKNQSEYFGGDIKWIVSGDVNKEFIYDVDGRITEAGYKNSNAKMLPKDSVLIALNGQGKTRGMVAILKTEACCNQSIIAFTPKNKEEFDHVFLFYYLKGSYQKLRNLTGDKERSGLSMSTLRPFQVIAPPIDIQRKVSDKLQRKYDEIRNISISFQKQKKSIDELPASILNEVFGQYQINS